jgi:hypothetical protein
MDRIQEMRSFVGMFFQMVKAFKPLVNALSKAAPEELSDIAGKVIPGTYYYSAHRQFLNEVMLSRSVESFDLYVLTTLRAIFRARPEMLKSEASIDVATIVDLRNFEEILTFIAERRLHELSFKPLSALDKFIQSRTGLPLFATPETFRTVLLASEVRNLTAHNDCIVNDLFRRRISGIDPDPGAIPTGKFLISDAWLREASYTIDGVVFDFDTRVSAKFGIPTVSSTQFRGTRPGAPAVEAMQHFLDNDDRS